MSLMNYKRYIKGLIFLLVTLKLTGCQKKIDNEPVKLTDYYIVAHVNMNGVSGLSVPNVITFTDDERGVYIWMSGHVGFSYTKSKDTINIELDEWNGLSMVKGVVKLSGTKISSLVIGEIKKWQDIEMIKIPAGNSFINSSFVGVLQNYHYARPHWTTEDTLSFSNNQFELRTSDNRKASFSYTLVNNGVAYGSSFDSKYTDPWVLVRDGKRVLLSHFSPDDVLSYGFLVEK